MIDLAGVTIHSKIYESSKSLVYRGRSEQDNRAHCFADIARGGVKLLRQDYFSPQELTRDRQEYKITRSLNLASVVQACGQQDYQRTVAILLEDFGGESIGHWMRCPEAFRLMPLSPFLPLAIDLSDILGKIHVTNIIHKNINPENIVQWRFSLFNVLGSNGQFIIDAIPKIELNIGKEPIVPKVGAMEAQNRFSRVFRQFMRVSCSKEHPLVLFLDALPWIDWTTLKLIELLLLDEQTNALSLK